jgi:hypothetical protein
MAICPICHKPGEKADDLFCAVHGARLIPDNGVAAAPTPPAAKPSSAPASTDESIPTDESSADQFRALRSQVAQRDARIAELEAELATAHRDLKTLGASTVTSDETPADDEEPAANNKPIAPDDTPEVAEETPDDKQVRTQSVDSSLEETEYVSPPPHIHGWLIGVGGVVAGARYGIGSDRIDIGRMKKFANGGIRINDKSVSNPHAFITVENDTVMLHDAGSTNGTFVGDKESERITKVPLKSGDTVVFAQRKVAEFVFKQK